MTYAIGDLLELGDDYLADKRFLLELDQNVLESIWVDVAHNSINPPTGVLFEIGEGDYSEVWFTWYRAPYRLDSVYERVV